VQTDHNVMYITCFAIRAWIEVARRVESPTERAALVLGSLCGRGIDGTECVIASSKIAALECGYLTVRSWPTPDSGAITAVTDCSRAINEQNGRHSTPSVTVAGATKLQSAPLAVQKDAATAYANGRQGSAGRTWRNDATRGAWSALHTDRTADADATGTLDDLRRC